MGKNSFFLKKKKKRGRLGFSEEGKWKSLNEGTFMRLKIGKGGCGKKKPSRGRKEVGC